MSSSAINTQVAQLKIGNVQNQADSSSIYSAGVWSFKNSTAVASVTITDAGNVGIGVTPSAWGVSTSGQLQLQDGVAYGRYGYTRNAYFDGSSWRYIGTGLTTQYLQSAGMHQWFTAPSGTAGNAITFAESMRIDASGAVKIGNTELSPVGTIELGRFGSGDRFSFIDFHSHGTSATVDFSARIIREPGAAGNLEVSNNSNGVRLSVNGTSWSAISDERKKKNIKPLEYGLAQISAIRPVRFDYKTEESDGSARVGFIAQELLPVIKEAVQGSEDTEYSVTPTDLIPVLVKALQELSAKVDAQAAEGAALRSEIEALKAK